MKNGNLRTKVADFLCRLTKSRRERYKQRNQKRLENPTPTIICNNCVGGAIYRDLNLQYLSPTANVLISGADFFRFVNRLEDYLTCVPEEIFLEGVSYPVGVLKYADEQVVLQFMHDTSFESAKEKWIRRCARVDLDNLYIVLEQRFIKGKIRVPQRSRYYKDFKAIKHPNKRFLLNAWWSFDKEIIPTWQINFFKKESILEYPTKYSKKRLLDQFDYVSFLNKK